MGREARVFLIPLPNRPVLPGVFLVPLMPASEKAVSEICIDGKKFNNRVALNENGSEDHRPSWNLATRGNNSVVVERSGLDG